MKITPDWLTKRVDVPPTSYDRHLPAATGLRTRMAWQKLKQQATEEGDEVWAFTSPPSTWKKQGTYAGYALVRDGRIVESILVTQG